VSAVRVGSGLVVLVTLLLAFAQVVAAIAEAIETPIDQQGCWTADPETVAAYTRRGLGVQECPAPTGYRLFLVSSDARSWVDVRSAGSGTTWSGENSVVYDSPIGNFPNVAGDTVEWRLESGRAKALIFKVVAQGRAEPSQTLSALYVVGLGSENIWLAGRAATIGEARLVADSGTSGR
jgi:hypothetical protein